MVEEAALDTTLEVNDLAAGNVQGSNPQSTAETVTGQLPTTDGNGNPLTYTAGSFTGTLGVLEIDSTGSFVYTLTSNSLDHTSQGTDPDNVIDQFTYTVTFTPGG